MHMYVYIYIHMDMGPRIYLGPRALEFPIAYTDWEQKEQRTGMHFAQHACGLVQAVALVGSETLYTASKRQKPYGLFVNTRQHMSLSMKTCEESKKHDNSASLTLIIRPEILNPKP